MIVVKIILFTLVVCSAGLLLGIAIWDIATKWLGHSERIGLKLYTGLISMILIGSIVHGVGGLISLPLSIAFVVMIFIYAFILLGGVITCRKKHKKILSGITLAHEKAGLCGVVTLALGIVVVVLQVAVVTGGQSKVSLAMKDVPLATQAYLSGGCVNGAAMMNLWGGISTFINEHPLTFIYCILPVVMFGCFYLGYYELAMKVLGQDVFKAGLVVISIGLLNIWGFQSEELIPVMMMFSWYTGWCFLVNGVLVLAPVVCMYYLDNKGSLASDNTIENDVAREENDEDYQEEWDMKKHKIINARNLAIALGVVAFMLVVFVFILNNKINMLHDATANLQNDLDKRTSVYEYVTKDGLSAGYLIKGKDGSLTMIGGGDESNADDLYDFLSEYGRDVTNWYLYDANAENNGACIKCIYEKGINVDNIYVLNRVEIEGL